MKQLVARRDRRSLLLFFLPSSPTKGEVHPFLRVQRGSILIRQMGRGRDKIREIESVARSNSILPERTVRLDYTGRDIHPCRGRKPQTWHDLGPLPLGGWGNFEIEFPDYLRSLPLGGGFPATK